MSMHRSRPPHYGIHRRTRLKVIDNSAIGKQAVLAGRAPMCIHVYKQGWREKHMPHAHLGDKILVAIKGEMKKAIVVGHGYHRSMLKHGIPRTDTNNIVLIDNDGNPLGTRILGPIPGVLRKERQDMGKLLAIATKFV